MKKYILFLLFFSLTRLGYSQYIYETVLSGLSSPIVFEFLPNNNIILTQKTGLAKIYTLNNVLVSTFWNFSDSTNSNGERGLIGVCLDPSYSSNHYIYFYYIDIHNLYRVVRLTENNNIGTNPFIVFNDTGSNISQVHVAGNIRFGSDNKLFISIGNGSEGPVGAANSQSIQTFKGKILRINSDGTIPADNPFYDDGNPHTGNDDRIWAYGLRNSFDFCFSPYNDSIYATENGDGSPDEINFIRKGKNYGYAFCTGYCFPYNPLYQNPMAEIPGNNFGDYAPTGIMFYTGNVMPEFTGKLLVVGAGEGQIFRGLLKCDLGNAPYNDTIISKSIINDWHGYTCLKQGNDGFIYGMNISNNGLNRMRPDLTYINNNRNPVDFSLSQNYPNPFNPITNIKFEIVKVGFVTLKIYDVIGNEVSTLISEKRTPGAYEINWEASNYPSGVYFYKLTVGEQSIQKKMVLIK